MPRESTSPPHPPGRHLVLVDEKDRPYLVQVPEHGRVLRLKGENLDHDTVAALHDGELLVTPHRRRYLVFLPTMEQLVMNMPREAQVIYPKDQALLLFYGDVAPGMEIIEVGVGHGAFTMALLRALGPEGRLTSYDLRLDHLNRTRKNISLYLGPEYLERWEPGAGRPHRRGLRQTASASACSATSPSPGSSSRRRPRPSARAAYGWPTCPPPCSSCARWKP